MAVVTFSPKQRRLGIIRWRVCTPPQCLGCFMLCSVFAKHKAVVKDTAYYLSSCCGMERHCTGSPTFLLLHWGCIQRSPCCSQLLLRSSLSSGTGKWRMRIAFPYLEDLLCVWAKLLKIHFLGSRSTSKSMTAGQGKSSWQEHHELCLLRLLEGILTRTHYRIKVVNSNYL